MSWTQTTLILSAIWATEGTLPGFTLSAAFLIFAVFCAWKEL